MIIICGLVWQHLLFKLGAASPLFLQTFSGKGVGVQGQEQEGQGDFVDLSRRPLLLDSDPEEEGWNASAKEIHCTIKKRKR